jgi:DNA-3-methyladenine glycosylase
MLNAVTEPPGVGAAVLIRALEPVGGIELMRGRRGVQPLLNLCSGPGKLTQALGVTLGDNDTSLADGPVVFSDRLAAWRDPPIAVSQRIGITKAVELPWRFCVAGSRFLSAPE